MFSQSYNFEYFSVEDGLPQSTANTIFQDSKGYLWIGTNGGGLCKFDGRNLTVYNEQDGIAGDFITGIAQDNENNLWFTSASGGVTRYDGYSFRIFTKKDGLIDDFGHTDIFIDSKGRIWIGSQLGIVVYHNEKIKQYTYESGHLVGNIINNISEDSKGNIWISTTNGITVFQDDNNFNITTDDGLLSNNVNVVLENTAGNYIIGTENGGTVLLKADFKDSNFVFQNDLLKTIKTAIKDILLDKEKNIWVATEKNGIYIINNKITHISKGNGLTGNYLKALLIDVEGNVWIGTDGAGLLKYANKAFKSFPKVEGLNNTLIFALEFGKDDDIWIGTGDEGVYKFNGKTTQQFTTKNGLGSNDIGDILYDKRDNLWFATGNGLTKYNNGAFTNYTTKDGLHTNAIRCLMLDNKDNLWIATYDNGISIYDYSSFKQIKDSNITSLVTTLFEDSKGNVWIGTKNGLLKYSNDKLTSYVDAKGFCNPYIASITEDNFGNIWIGTDKCVVKYDGLEFTSIPLDNGFSSNAIYLTHKDKNGTIWVGTNNGLEKVTFDSYGEIKNIKNYRSKQGFKGIECNDNAILEDKNGVLWIGTINGLIKYNPTQDKTNVFEPKTHINNIKLFHENIDWLKHSKELTKWSNLPKKLELAYNENHLTFEFLSINLTLPENVHYRFKLTPFDEEWVNSTTQTSATYSNLTPGDYTFEVKARNEDGLWNQHPVSYKFTILPPWWKKWWVIAIFICAFLYVLYNFSLSKEKKQKEISKELEKKVIERTALIASQRDEKEILLKEIHHRVKNNMQVIISLLSIQSGYSKDEETVQLFKEAQNRIRSMALTHEKMYQSGDLAHIDFKDYINSLSKDLIDIYAVNCDVLLETKIENAMFNIDTLIPLGLLLSEIFSNALKYAFKGLEKGKMFFQFYKNDNDSYTIIVGDNGGGMLKGTLEKEDESLGIELIKIFVSQLDGTIKRLDKKGTFFEINFTAQGNIEEL